MPKCLNVEFYHIYPHRYSHQQPRVHFVKSSETLQSSVLLPVLSPIRAPTIEGTLCEGFWYLAKFSFSMCFLANTRANCGLLFFYLKICIFFMYGFLAVSFMDFQLFHSKVFYLFIYSLWHIRRNFFLLCRSILTIFLRL